MRTFQLNKGKSHQFWNIEVKGKSFTITEGKVGTLGKTQTKSFASPKAARDAAEKLINQKTKKGFVETTPKPLSADAEAFARSLSENPEDLAGWSAFADYLTEHDDPRGEFMQTQLALEDESRPKKERDALKRKEKALLKEYEREWLGPLAEVAIDAEPVTYWAAGGKEKERAPVSHAFTRGWISRLEFFNLRVNQARAMARSPGARLVRELIVHEIEMENPVGKKESYIDSYYLPGPDVPKNLDNIDEPGLHALCRCPHLASVRVFQLGLGSRQPNPGGSEDNDSCHTSGEQATTLINKMPHVEELHLFAHSIDGDRLFGMTLTNLRVLQLYHSHDYPLEKLANNKSLTNLTRLRCHPHAIEYYDAADGAYIRLPHLRAICRSPNLKSLTHLCLRLTDFGDAGAEEIASSGILKQLKVLDLYGGSITDDGAKTLAACPDLKNLEFLNLRSNALTKAGKDAIKKTGVKADTANQHHNEPGEFGDDDIPDYLFDGDYE